MLFISITADEPDSLAAASPIPTDGLPAMLAHYGVPPALIQQALTILTQHTTLLLCKPSDKDEWEMQQRCC
jgi:hypothetical protein